MTTPTADYVHLILFPVDGPPRPQCGGSGRSVMRVAEVTCPGCLQLPAVRSLQAAEPEVHDAHAIPATDEPEPATAEEINPGDICRDRDDDEWVAVSTGHQTFLVDAVFLHGIKEATEKWGPLVKYDFGEGGPISDAAAALAPVKTHDLSIVRVHGNVVIEAAAETDGRAVYLQDGAALDLGRVLDALTPTQRELLIDDLKGGAK